MRASINTQLVRIELVISVDRDHRSKMDRIESPPATHPVTEVGQAALTVIEEKRNNATIAIVVYVNSDIKETNPFFSSAG